MQRSLVLKTQVTAAAVLALVVAMPAKSVAGSRGLGIGVGVGAGLMLLNEAARAASGKGNRSEGRSRRSGGGKSDDADEKESSSDSSGSSKKAAEQKAAKDRNVAAQYAESQEIDRLKKMERDRNVQQAIDDLINELKTKHWASVTDKGTSNQVSEGEIKTAIEDAYNKANLRDFDKLAGELWTRDRLTVRIVDRSTRELGAYFKGVGLKGISKDELKELFLKSANRVYEQALQTAELIGVSYSFSRFIRTIYEQSDRADESLWTIGADGHYDRLVADLVESIPRQEFISDDRLLASDPLGLDNQFKFRFRARRAVYDCMAARYTDLISKSQAGTIQISSPQAGMAAAAPSPRNATGDVAKPAALGGSVWENLREATNSICRSPLTMVRDEVKSGGVRPKPARWDYGNALNNGSSPIIPAQTLDTYR